MTIPGYAYGTTPTRSPISMAELAQMKQSVQLGDDDVSALRRSHGIIKDQVEDILDVWYGFIAATPHLVASFTSRDHGKPIGDYLGGVRRRFGQWILDTARAEYDQTWLDWQHEIGLRHHRSKKNTTDGVTSTDIVPFRHLFLVIVPITQTLVPFLARRGHTADEVEQMRVAWVKSCLLQMTLWTHPYVTRGDF